MSLTHPPVHMAESSKFKPEVLLRVHEDYVVAYGSYEEEGHRIGTRWVNLQSGKVFPQSRGYATWDLIPEDDEVSYLKYLLNLDNIDSGAVLRLLQTRLS